MGGDTIGPYRITEQLGSGGMGEVFKAYDDRLDRWVAIKRIRPDKEEDAENRERFRREAKAAARLNHSALVHIYDIFQEAESDCIVMEFVEGRALNELIADGPLDPVRAATLAREIAEGLSEAHSKGIVHRDLKTENVIITPSGRAKILDFGLAKPVRKTELDASLTGRGQVVGTSRAMSPEYVSGEEVDHRADLFALGVLLYESLTCQSPFRGHNTLATLKRIILHRQVPVKELNSDVPEELSDLVDRLLEKEPRDRPQSAREVALELGRFSTQLSSSTIEALGSSHGTVQSTVSHTSALATAPLSAWRQLALMLLVLVGVVAFALVLWRLLRPPITEERFTFEARDEILVSDFENKTGDPLLDESLEYAFRLGLEQSRYAKVVSRQRVQAALRRMQLDADTKITAELGLEICQRESIKALIVGRVVKVGSDFSISAQILDPNSQSSVLTVTGDPVQDKDDLLAEIQDLAKELRSNLGESLDAIEATTQPLETVTTPNLEALKTYSLAVTKIAEGQPEAAVPLLKRSIELDPEFAMALARLGLVYRNMDTHLDQIPALFQKASRYSNRLMGYEKLYVEGWTAHTQGEVEEEIQAWQLMSNLYPEDPTGHTNLGLAYWLYQHRFTDAIDVLRRAHQLEPSPRRASILLVIGLCQMAQGQYEEARRNLERAVTVGGSELATGLTSLSMVVRDYAEARRQIEMRLASDLKAARALAQLELSLFYADQGQIRAALTALEPGRAARDRGDETLTQRTLVWASLYHELMGSRQDALRVLSGSAAAARQLAEQQGEPGFSLMQLQTIIGKLAARNGDVERAKDMLRDVQRLREGSSAAIWESYSRMLEGEILAAEGQVAEAIISLRAALSSLVTIQSRESLARVYREAGRIDEAIEEYEWIVAHRGWAFGECEDICPWSAFNAVDWALASFRLGALYEQRGEATKAIEAYRRFVDHWQNGDPQLRQLIEADGRIRALSED